MTKFRLGYWLSILGIVLSVAYLLAIVAAMLFDSLPPHEPYQSVIGVVSLVSVPVLVLLWVAINESVPHEKRIFATGSLALMIIFGALTSFNRYTSLTVVSQAVAQGQTDGLNWFQPYGWPSIMAAAEVLAWGFYLALAFFCLAPAFGNGKIERAIVWTLVTSGGICLLATLGQVLNNAWLNMVGILAWGPGLITLLTLLLLWFKRNKQKSVQVHAITSAD